MSEITLIDTHLHIIDRSWARYGWTAQVPALDGRDFALAEAKVLYAGRVAGSIFMEVDVDAADMGAEAAAVAGLVRSGGLLGQIAACRPEVEAGFDDWLDKVADLGVVGLRRILHVVPDEVSLSDTFKANIRKIGARGLPFDLNLLARQLPLGLLLIRACPDVQFVLDHCGVPDVAAGGMDPWRADMTALAGLPNVVVKMSGITTYAGARGPQAVLPYIDHLLEVFGPARIVWGSDWPVVNLGAGMDGWLKITLDILGKLTADEAAAIGHRNAMRVYGVTLP